MNKIIGALAALLLVALSHPAEAKHRHNHSVRVPEATGCLFTNEGRTVCGGSVKAASGHYYGSPARSGVTFIPNPPGTWRSAKSCAQRLAAYWGLGNGLDAVRTWVKKFPRVSGPGIGIAAVRHDQHHIMGIIGGGPGAWRVADFNSGDHLNREYTVSNFGPYFFVDPHGSRIAMR